VEEVGREEVDCLSLSLGLDRCLIVWTSGPFLGTRKSNNTHESGDRAPMLIDALERLHLVDEYNG
jgi:hypothetical protein